MLARLFLLLLIIFSTPSIAGKKVTLGVVLFPPYVMLDEVTSECVGNVINITKKILDEYAHDLDVICARPSRVYKLMHEGVIDFTINIIKSNSLPDHTSFIDTPFRKIELKLYSHKATNLNKEVAAIKGFNYQGQRAKLSEQGYKFIDMPTSISAIQVFLKKQSDYLISYSSSVDYYIKEKKLNIADNISTQYILETTSHYAISGTSPFNKSLQKIFNDYAHKHQVTYFNLVQ
jgi:polar amino acid transport system substrate-binding protein